MREESIDLGSWAYWMDFVWKMIHSFVHTNFCFANHVKSFDCVGLVPMHETNGNPFHAHMQAYHSSKVKPRAWPPCLCLSLDQQAQYQDSGSDMLLSLTAVLFLISLLQFDPIIRWNFSLDG